MGLFQFLWSLKTFQKLEKEESIRVLCFLSLELSDENT